VGGRNTVIFKGKLQNFSEELSGLILYFSEIDFSFRPECVKIRDLFFSRNQNKFCKCRRESLLKAANYFYTSSTAVF
jgi:hypothetical protein